MKFHFVIFTFLLTFTAHCSAATPSPQEPPVTVEGILQVGEFLGPPNYGENPDSDLVEHS